MNDIHSAIILGVIQGLTEFLPVSISRHTKLNKFLLGDSSVTSESSMMSVVLLFSTALTTVYVFQKEVLHQIFKFFSNEGANETIFIYKVVISLIPVAIITIIFENQLKALFTSNILLVCYMLIVSGCLLFAAYKAIYSGQYITYFNVLRIRIAKAIANTPYISITGTTITSLFMTGVGRTKALDFHFLW